MAQKEAVDHVQQKQDYLRVVDEVGGAPDATAGLEAFSVNSSGPQS